MFPTIDALAAGLAALDEHGWVRPLEPPRRPGRPTSRYETNPAMFLEAWTKWPEPARSPNTDDVLSILSMDSVGSATDALEREGAPREPELPAPKDPPPLDRAELGDWFAGSIWDTDPAAPDEWGTLG
jgi:hypothetical protein